LFISHYGFEEFADAIVIFDRISTLAESGDDASTFETRFKYWERGFERVLLSPLLGIKKTSSGQFPINFTNPHNEFIFLWTYTGLLGLLAFLFLFLYLILINFRSSGLLNIWILIYLSFIIIMFFDSSFSLVKIYPFFFILVGINIYELKKPYLPSYEKSS
jgi:O-antigen ligase